jgi:serine/threonine protein phosphatase PrpC
MPVTAFGPLDVAQLTDVGLKRKHNEDACRMVIPPADAPEAAFGALFLVADGMGGLGGGDIASKAAIDALLRAFYDLQDREADPAIRLEDSIEAANRYVREQASQVGLARIGSTGAGLLFRRGGEVVAFNVGDCRVYRIRNGQITRISRDQSVMQRQIDLGMSEEEAKSARSSQVTAFLGQPMVLQAFIVREQSQPGDVYLICSDGLWSLVDDADLLKAINGVPAQKAVEKLIKLARAKGGNDNITAMIIRVGNVPGRVGRLLVPLALAAVIGALGLGAAFALGGGSLQPTPTQTATLVPPTATELPTEAPTNTAPPPSVTPQPTALPSATPTDTATVTPSPTLTNTATRTPSATHTETPTPSQTPSLTPSATNTSTNTPAPTVTASPTASLTLTPSATLTASFTPSRTATATEVRPPTITIDPALILTLFTATSTPSLTRTPTATPTATRTPTVTPTATNTFTAEEAQTATRRVINQAEINRRRTLEALTATASGLSTRQAELQLTQDAINTSSPPEPPENPGGGDSGGGG